MSWFLLGTEVAATSVPNKTMTINPPLAVHMHLYETQRLSKVLFTTLKISLSLLFWVGLFIPKIVFRISGQGTSEGKGTNHLSFFLKYVDLPLLEDGCWFWALRQRQMRDIVSLFWCSRSFLLLILRYTKYSDLHGLK